VLSTPVLAVSLPVAPEVAVVVGIVLAALVLSSDSSGRRSGYRDRSRALSTTPPRLRFSCRWSRTWRRRRHVALEAPPAALLRLDARRDADADQHVDKHPRVGPLGAADRRAVLNVRVHHAGGRRRTGRQRLPVHRGLVADARADHGRRGSAGRLRPDGVSDRGQRQRGAGSAARGGDGGRRTGDARTQPGAGRGCRRAAVVAGRRDAGLDPVPRALRRDGAGAAPRPRTDPLASRRVPSNSSRSGKSTLRYAWSVSLVAWRSASSYSSSAPSPAYRIWKSSTVYSALASTSSSLASRAMSTAASASNSTSADSLVTGMAPPFGDALKNVATASGRAKRFTHGRAKSLLRDRGVAWYPSSLGCSPPRFKSGRSHYFCDERT
jgi:hypothetical protein